MLLWGSTNMAIGMFISSLTESQMVAAFVSFAVAGVPFDGVGWHAAFVPAATPPAVVARLNAAFTKALARPDIRARIVNGGSVPIEPALTAEQWTQQIRREVAQWAEVVRLSGAKAE